VIAPPQFHRRWWDAYAQINQRFAATAAAAAAPNARVWVHDYQLQLVPALLQHDRPDLRIGFFSHIPFPGYEIFAQLPWRRQIIEGLLGANRAELGKPEIVLLGVDRLDYTKGILHWLKAYEELLDDGELGPPQAVFVQVASPSRERVQHYQLLREEIEGTVGRINGTHGTLGQPAVHYLHHSYPRQEMAALYLAADVMLVTPLRDGMNLVAKEYVACRQDETAALVLSEFTGAADELGSAFLVNPHDIEGLKGSILRAVRVTPREARRRMRSMRRRVRDYDVNRWASCYLDALEAAPAPPGPAEAAL